MAGSPTWAPSSLVDETCFETIIEPIATAYFFPLRYVSNARTNVPMFDTWSSQSKKSICVTSFLRGRKPHSELPATQNIITRP